jgi:hypothetical protein
MYMFKARERARQEHRAALDEYGITEEQAREFLKGSRYANSFYKAPHVVAGTSADLIHQIGPLVGKGPLGRAKVHAKRAAARSRSWVSKDLPHARQTFGKMAPYLPSLGRLIYVELKEKLPSPKAAWVNLMRRVVPQSDGSADAVIPTGQQYISAAAPPEELGSDTLRLQVVG